MFRKTEGKGKEGKVIKGVDVWEHDVKSNGGRGREPTQQKNKRGEDRMGEGHMKKRTKQLGLVLRRVCAAVWCESNIHKLPWMKTPDQLEGNV